MKTERITVKINPNPKSKDERIANLSHPLEASPSFFIPTTIPEWKDLIGSRLIIEYLTNEYVKRAKVELKERTLELCEEKKEHDNIDMEKSLQIFARDFIPNDEAKELRKTKAAYQTLDKSQQSMLKELFEKGEL